MVVLVPEYQGTRRTIGMAVQTGQYGTLRIYTRTKQVLEGWRLNAELVAKDR
jgi:hypothetical protein